jgi:hypothetical protein
MKHILRITTLAVLATALFATAFTQDASNFKEAGKIWGKVKADLAAFDKTVKAKKWKEVHEAAFAVRDDVFLLPDASKALAKEKMAKLKEHLRIVGSLAGELDEAGDANNGKLVVATASKFRTHVNAIPALYPKGALPTKVAAHTPAKAGGHGGHHGGGH